MLIAAPSPGTRSRVKSACDQEMTGDVGNGGGGGCASINESLTRRMSAYHRKWLSEEHEATRSFREGIPGGWLFGKTFPNKNRYD